MRESCPIICILVLAGVEIRRGRRVMGSMRLPLRPGRPPSEMRCVFPRQASERASERANANGDDGEGGRRNSWALSVRPSLALNQGRAHDRRHLHRMRFLPPSVITTDRQTDTVSSNIATVTACCLASLCNLLAHPRSPLSISLLPISLSRSLEWLQQPTKKLCRQWRFYARAQGRQRQ